MDHGRHPTWMPKLLLVMAAIAAVNALWMLGAPEHWYHEIPAGVPDFGPLNDHFVRDVGCVFATLAVALAVAARRPAWRLPLVGTATLFFGLHAALHVFDTARGAVDAHHWLLDLPGVYLPAGVLLFLTHRLRSDA